MKKTKKLVFATNNNHKLEEARQIISDKFEIVSLSDIGCHDDIPETADTLEGNALIKARWVKEKYGYDCFADDTGLSVDALDGRPGVMSARYAGEHCSPADNVEKLLKEMKNIQNRDASFATVIALAADGEEHTFEGRVEGYISQQPCGDGGFGYDPVFIEKESGVSFAEMTPEAKNSVSHRGRALRKLCKFLGVVTAFIASLAFASSASAQQWRMHSSYDGEMLRIADGPRYVYFLGTKQYYHPASSLGRNLHGVLFRYDKESDEMTSLNPSNILAGNTVKAIAYNYGKKYLAVALDDGVIQLIYDNGTVKTIRGLQTAEPSLDKIVNDFTFDNANDRIYASTNFGFIVINDKNHEIETSRIFNKKINSAALYKGKLWLAADDGIYYGEPTEFNLSNYKFFDSGNNISNFTIAGENMYFTSGILSSVYLRRLNYDGSAVSQTTLSSSAERSFQRGEEGVMTVTGNSQIRWVDNKGNMSLINLPSGYDSTEDAGSRDGRNFWFSSGRKGFSNLSAPGADGKWTLLKNRFFPNASSAFMCASMAYHPDYGMLVRNHGYESPFAGSIVVTNDLISGYKDMNWSQLSTTYRTDMPGLLIDSPFGLAIDPNNPNHVYCGSERSGLLRLDLKDPQKSIHFSKKSDFLGGYGQPGFAVIAPENPEGTWEQQCVFATPAFDSYGNLWTTHVNPEAGLDASSYTEFWVWPAAERAATTSADNVNGWKKIKISNLVTSNAPVLLPLKYVQNKNLVVHAGNNVSEAMIVLDHNNTLDSRADDRIAKMKTLYDQDGNTLPFYRALSMYEDPATGLVWIGFEYGLFTFNPQEVFKDPTSVKQIKVPRNDGTNLADYLLSGTPVNYITSDPSGRKWFATSGAGLVCTSADGRQILASYTTANSMIPGDNVYSACYNPSNGSMMISTDKGLCELFIGGASSSSDDSDVRVYPNPVRPDYFGYVTIDGLPEGAMVKIVDTAGNLIKECGDAYNGIVEWDVTNMFNKRVPGGVYFVVATNGQDSDSYNKVGKILVVN